MADNTDVSDKEKQTAKQEEKEKDTAEGPAKAKSPTPSKPGSAKGSKAGSKPGSAKSGSAAPAGKAGKGGGKAPAKGAKGKKKKDEEEKPPEATPAPEGEEGGLPEGVVPIFLSSKTQEIFDAKVDEDVSEENPFKFLAKQDILNDLFNRAAICDFHPFKPIIQNYPADEILVVYDPDFKWGQNFIIATTEEAKEKLLKSPEGEAGEEGEEGAAAEAEEQVVYKYVPPEPKDWVSLGSEKEIVEEAMEPNRKKVKFAVVRKRREFGAYVEFKDRNVADAKDAYQECTPYEDRTFDLKTMERTKGTQAVPEFQDTAAQTDWKYPRNATTQYYARELSEQEIQDNMQSEKLAEVMKNSYPRFELALQQNHVMDVFFDDWMNLGDDDSSFGSKADNHLKEYQSFTDLQFSKDKTVTCIDWHPTIKGVVAVAVAEKLSFDEKIDLAHRVIMTPSLILIWSFTDPIHPQLLLEAPDDILCFKFMPTDPNIICGGCTNGQVVLWDISQHAERLKVPRGGKRKNNLNTLPGFEDENAMDTPIVRYCAVSSIEHSHKAGITDIQWVPDHLEVNRMGVPHENQSGNNVQLMTCAVDHTVLFWDTRPPKTAHSMLAQAEKKKDTINNPMGVANTFKHLDLTWKPHLKITLYKSEPGGDHSPTKFSITESQGDKNHLSGGDDDKKSDPTQTGAGGFSFGGAGGRQGSGKRTLSKVKTHFYVGTEDGELVYADWMPQKDQDTGKIQTPKPDYYHTLHDGAISTLQRSPFFRDVILLVGGWTFSIWKEGIKSGPILQSSASNKKLTAGFWSPSRPGIFFITKQDGSIDTWDLLDRTHEPSMNQSVTPVPITCIFPYQVTSKQHLLAVGDTAGTLHILEIPWSLRQATPNELTGVTNYFDREIKRRSFVVSRWNFREKEKIEIEQEAKRKAGIAPAHHLTDEELVYRMKQEYQQYLDEEASFLRELGLKEVEEEPLPETD